MGKGPNRPVTQSRLCYAAVFEEQGLFLHFWSGVGYGPVGLWGMKGSSLLAFGEQRRKTEVSTPLLYNRAERVWKGRRFGGRNESEDRQSSGSALPIRQVVQHRSVSGDVECLAGRKIHLIRCGNYYDFLLFLHQIFTSNFYSIWLWLNLVQV